MDEILCRHGCGRPGKVYGRRGDLPRCAAKVSDCPAVARAAGLARKNSARRSARPSAASPRFKPW